MPLRRDAEVEAATGWASTTAEAIAVAMPEVIAIPRSPELNSWRHVQLWAGHQGGCEPVVVELIWGKLQFGAGGKTSKFAVRREVTSRST